jgi:large subunit ribosomal protein L4
VRGLARRSAFNARAEEDRVILVDAFKMEAPKTAQLRDYLGTIEADGKVLLLTEGQKENVYLSARNLPQVEVRPFGEESVYDVLWATTVVIERGALENAEAPKAAKKKEEAADA